MLKVYIAGCYSSDTTLGTLDNIRKGMRAGTEVLLSGFAPFVPWFDFHFQLMLQDDEELEVENYYNYSMEWLKVSNAILVLSGYTSSVGTLTEIAMAEMLKIPVFYSLEALKEWKWSCLK